MEVDLPLFSFITNYLPGVIKRQTQQVGKSVTETIVSYSTSQKFASHSEEGLNYR